MLCGIVFVTHFGVYFSGGRQRLDSFVRGAFGFIGCVQFETSEKKRMKGEQERQESKHCKQWEELTFKNQSAVHELEQLQVVNTLLLCPVLTDCCVCVYKPHAQQGARYHCNVFVWLEMSQRMLLTF